MGYKRSYGRGGVATQTLDIQVFGETADSGVVGAGTYKTITFTPANLRSFGEVQFLVVNFHARSVGNVAVKLNGTTVQTVNVPATATDFPAFRNSVFIPVVDKSISHVITIVNDSNQIFESITVDARTTVVV